MPDTLVPITNHSQAYRRELIDGSNESPFLTDDGAENKKLKKFDFLWFFAKNRQNFRFFVISGICSSDLQTFFCLNIKLI